MQPESTSRPIHDSSEIIPTSRSQISFAGLTHRIVTSRKPSFQLKSSIQSLNFGHTDEQLYSWNERQRSYNHRTYQCFSEDKEYPFYSNFPSSAPPVAISLQTAFNFPGSRPHQVSAQQRKVSFAVLDSASSQPRPPASVESITHKLENRDITPIVYPAATVPSYFSAPFEEQQIQVQRIKPVEVLPALTETLEFASDVEFSRQFSAIESDVSSGRLTVAYSSASSTTRFFQHFSMWLSFVHLATFLSALFLFGNSPFGSGGKTKILGRVLTPSLVVNHVCRAEFQSWFIGLRYPDLIRLGARFGPCLRPDTPVAWDVVERQRALDRASGCCVRHDGSGCFQTRRERCSPLLSTWLRYDSTSDTPNDSALTRPGPVCGLDPAYCLDPHSSARAVWNGDDVTHWPICPVSFNQTDIPDHEAHMRCRVTGRPCCVGILGECIITTKEHCAFVRGVYNPRAALCSQVDCLEKSCGLWGFSGPRNAFQFHRIFLSLFIHSNVLELLLSLFLQLVHMQLFEQVMNWWRVCFIFLLSDALGSLVSVLAHPYQIGYGPSHMGILVAQLLDFAYYRTYLKDEYRGILCLSMSIICLFLLGFFPGLDNMANIGSGLAGILLYYVFAPWYGHHWLRFVATVGYLTAFATLTILVHWLPVTNCEWCQYLNCAPFIPNSCDRYLLGSVSQLDCIPVNW